MAYFMQSMRDRQNGVEDLCLMTGTVNDETIVKQLEVRLTQGKIHTSIGTVLIICNPFRSVPIYGPSHVKLYQTANMSDTSPHIFGLAERAYRRMVTDHKPQAVLISGESGAGKTESAKLILHYASAVSGSSPQAQRMKQIILECNPLLEAFGNAKTTRNNNSSRFGKYLNLTFNEQGEPAGGTTSNFLLEKTRVTFQQKNERNFHIFYQMLEGAWPQLLTACKMGRATDYSYLSQSGTYDVPGVDDGRNFREVQRACGTVGIAPPEQWYLFSTLCGILHLGNAKLIGKDAPAKLAQGGEQWIGNAAYLWGIDPTLMLTSINHKTVTMGGKRASVVKVPQNADQATQIRDALAKEMFSRLFDYIISKVNGAMRSQGYPGNTLGVLDIYGFEIFDVNLFEQLCINFVNEKLQQIFLDAVVKGEQQLYIDQGLEWKMVPFFDNAAICALIEGRQPPGIFLILDDTCRALHAVDSDTADTKFVEKLSQGGLGGNKYLRLRPGTSNFAAGFTITHFAGEVTYSCKEMAFKNMDNLFGSIVDTMKTSTSPFMRFLWPLEEDRISQAPATSSTKIRGSAGDLVAELRRCETHYVRCIKSNDDKAPMTIDHPRVKEQVQFQALAENTRVKKAGYSYRAPYDQFNQKYSQLATRHGDAGMGNGRGGAQKLAAFISKKWPDLCPASEFGWGRDLVFLHSPETIFALDELLEEARDPKGYAEKIRMHEEAERAAMKQDAKVQKGSVKGKGGCAVS